MWGRARVAPSPPSRLSEVPGAGPGRRHHRSWTSRDRRLSLGVPEGRACRAARSRGRPLSCQASAEDSGGSIPDTSPRPTAAQISTSWSGTAPIAGAGDTPRPQARKPKPGASPRRRLHRRRSRGLPCPLAAARARGAQFPRPARQIPDTIFTSPQRQSNDSQV